MDVLETNNGINHVDVDCGYLNAVFLILHGLTNQKDVPFASSVWYDLVYSIMNIVIQCSRSLAIVKHGTPHLQEYSSHGAATLYTASNVSV